MLPWEYRCPNGHAGWRTFSDYYECEQCGLKFDELVHASEFSGEAVV